MLLISSLNSKKEMKGRSGEGALRGFSMSMDCLISFSCSRAYDKQKSLKWIAVCFALSLYPTCPMTLCKRDCCLMFVCLARQWKGLKAITWELLIEKLSSLVHFTRAQLTLSSRLLKDISEFRRNTWHNVRPVIVLPSIFADPISEFRTLKRAPDVDGGEICFPLPCVREKT